MLGKRGVTIASLDELLTKKTQVIKLLKLNLSRARNWMIQQSNLHRKDMVFEVGQWVYLKLQPYRQTSIHRRSSQKFSKRFYDPFLITKHIGPVAYELDLPATTRIHPIFMLKLCRVQPSIQVSPLPDPSAFPPLQATPLCWNKMSINS